MSVSRRTVIRRAGVGAVVGLAGCVGMGGDGATDSERATDSEEGDDSGTDDVRAAFVYHDAVGDFGWQWAHDRARRIVEEEYDWLETKIFDNLSPEGSEPMFRQYAERGFDVIFGTSWDYMDPMYEVAPEYPNVAFENCSGYKQRENMGRYFGRIYQPRYLTGVAAGQLTEVDEIGYVAAFPTSEVVRGINAFAHGVSSANSEATVTVEYTGTWSDADIETGAAETLIEQGVDVMAQHQNYPAAAQAASDAGIWATGYNSPMGEYVGNNYVTSPIWNWEVFYRQTVSDLHDGTWEADFYWDGLAAGIVDLSEWGPKVPVEVRETVADRREAIEAGDLDVWAGTPFEDYDDEQLFREVDSYVDTVAGTVPE